MRFGLVPRLMTLDDLELSNFRRISQIWEAATTFVTQWMYFSTCSLHWFAVDFFASGLHTLTAVVRLC